VTLPLSQAMAHLDGNWSGRSLKLISAGQVWPGWTLDCEDKMNVSPATAAPTPTSPQPAAQTAKITSDFDTFLRMLTVQMQNQDPLNPMDSADYAVQLATFSGVEQQVRTNQLLSDMQSRYQQSGIAEMAGWIGKEARSPAPVRYEGAPVTLYPAPAAGATAVDLVVRDMQGRLVAREAMPVSAAPYRWLGADATGTPLPSGSYQLSLESRTADAVTATTGIDHYARVIEVRAAADGTKLVLAGGTEVPAAQVTAIRESGALTP
jgi:flagellar basal-body rod modification protein FlgD